MPPKTLYGPWDYAKVRQPYPYDDTETYAIAGEYLSGSELVEDWGCGVGWAKRFIDAPYRGVDGAWSRFAEIHADLREYRSHVPSAFMRHVLEHNADWRVILDNFMKSWRDRAALVLFIPPAPQDDYLSDETWPVPDIAISGPDLMQRIGDHVVETLVVPTTSQYDSEIVFLMSR